MNGLDVIVSKGSERNQSARQVLFTILYQAGAILMPIIASLSWFIFDHGDASHDAAFSGVDELLISENSYITALEVTKFNNFYT